MKVALVNPPWRFNNSIYFGCREPHLPLELGACRVLLEQRGHTVLLLDGHLEGRDAASLADEIAEFRPAMTVITTAPSYLFWRCAPPELRIPREMIVALDGRGGRVVAVGPHGSVTPRSTLKKLGADLVVRGECEEAVAALADAWPRTEIPGCATFEHDELQVFGPVQATRFTDLAPIKWPDAWIQRHHHHHHRFDTLATVPGAEVEASRGCPYHCSFCAKIDFRDGYRRRDQGPLLEEIFTLRDQGVEYLYFIDEIFLPQQALLESLVGAGLKFGLQTRIDLWKPHMLDLLGRAGCVSIEAGVESLTEDGRAALDKSCRMTTDDLTQRLITARQHVPFVQANLIESAGDDEQAIQFWRMQLQQAGVWANDPVPLFPYPSSPDYRKRWGLPDDDAWERALNHYLDQFTTFSDIQEAQPHSLARLEADCLPA